MKTGPAGLHLIKTFEGLKLNAYKCPAGVWTIGYGTTKGVKPGQAITAAKAEELLAADLRKFEDTVNTSVAVPITQGQFDALVSLTYNIGSGAFRASTLLRKLNAKDYAGAAEQFPRWNRAGGKVLAGLTRRREAERKLFEGKA
jgi:lysozyme